MAKYYVGAKHLTEGWEKSEIGDAIDHARKLLATDHSVDELNIVKVVGVVKREHPPVTFTPEPEEGDKI